MFCWAGPSPDVRPSAIAVRRAARGGPFGVESASLSGNCPRGGSRRRRGRRQSATGGLLGGRRKSGTPSLHDAPYLIGPGKRSGDAVVRWGVRSRLAPKRHSRTARPDLRQNARVGRPDDIRLSFNEAAAIYDEIRPSYPPELFDTLLQLLPSGPEIVEVGPGTGQATKDLLARGARVHAIEIGSAMAAKLRSNLPSDRLRVSVGDFEKLDVATASADAVFSATAYHWIARPAQTDRPASLLRPGGVIAIVDLIQVDSPSDLGFFAAGLRAIRAGSR